MGAIGFRSMRFSDGLRHGEIGPGFRSLRDDAVEVSEVFHLKDADWIAFDEESARRFAAGWRLLGRAYITHEPAQRGVLNATFYRPLSRV